MKRELGLDEPAEALGGHRTSTLTKRLAHSAEEDVPRRPRRASRRGRARGLGSRGARGGPAAAGSGRHQSRRIGRAGNGAPKPPPQEPPRSSALGTTAIAATAAAATAIAATAGAAARGSGAAHRRRDAGADIAEKRAWLPRPKRPQKPRVAQPPPRETPLMAVLAWGMMGLGDLALHDLAPRSVLGRIVGALIGALIGAIFVGLDDPRVLGAVATRHRSGHRAGGDSGDADRARGDLVRGACGASAPAVSGPRWPEPADVSRPEPSGRGPASAGVGRASRAGRLG